jgi:hypothetical protein
LFELFIGIQKEKAELARALHNVASMKVSACLPVLRAKAVWGPKRIFVSFAAVAISFCLGSDASAQGRHRNQAPKDRPGVANTFVKHDKMDSDVARRAGSLNWFATADVIVTLEDGADLPLSFQRYSHNGKLSVIHGYVLDQVPAWQLATLASLSGTHRVHYNRLARKHDALSSVAVNANAVDTGNGINNPNLYSFTGAGVTVAFIDSGITSYAHPDLADNRLLAFVDFVNGSSTRYDDNGHGTHVAGVISGSGRLSAKKYAGMAPGASLVSLKVLNQDGEGTVGNILKALDWVYKNGNSYGIRVVNLSVGAAVTESYYTDPLTLATKTLVDSGITVVAAAGSNGQTPLDSRSGAALSPGARPGCSRSAFSTLGTTTSPDDTVAGFSSSGPTAVDFTAKPDICAPESAWSRRLRPRESVPVWIALVAVVAQLWTVPTLYPCQPYLAFSPSRRPAGQRRDCAHAAGESNLTPNLIKAILEFTAISKPESAHCAGAPAS